MSLFSIVNLGARRGGCADGRGLGGSGAFPAAGVAGVGGTRRGILKGLHKDKSAEKLLRVLLLRPGCGHSLRETVVRARKANLRQLSDVALLKRLRKSKEGREYRRQRTQGGGTDPVSSINAEAPARL